MEMNHIGFCLFVYVLNATDVHTMVCSCPCSLPFVVVSSFSNIQRVALAMLCECHKMSCSSNVKIEPMNIYEPCMRPCLREWCLFSLFTLFPLIFPSNFHSMACLYSVHCRVHTLSVDIRKSLSENLFRFYILVLCFCCPLRLR